MIGRGFGPTLPARLCAGCGGVLSPTCCLPSSVRRPRVVVSAACYAALHRAAVRRGVTPESIIAAACLPAIDRTEARAERNARGR